MEIKPWFLRVEFWTPVVAILSILLSQFFGVKLDEPALVALVLMIIGIIWGAVSVENKVIEAKREMYLADVRKEMGSFRHRPD